jgi:hypothetical protein
MDDRPPHVDPDSDHRLCGVCPALRYPREQFVIYDRPNREAPFDPVDGHRYTADGSRRPACVHPDKIGLEPDHIAPPYAPATEGNPAVVKKGSRLSGRMHSFLTRNPRHPYE